MSYRRALLVRWSRRDVLAAVALAAIVAFLTGSALFYAAAADRPTNMASEFGPVGSVAEYESPAAPQRVVTEDSIVLPYARTGESGVLVVGISASDLDAARRAGLAVPERPDRGIGRSAGTERQPADTITVGGRERNVTATVESGFLPERWYVASEDVIERVGPSGVFVITPTSHANGVGTPNGASRVQSVIRGSLGFFERGAAQLLRGFVMLVVAAGVLGAVTVTSVVRMTVVDRARTIRVIRATGGTPGLILRLFALRGVLLTLAAIAVGYAVGVVVSSLVVSLAVFAGLPTTLSPRVTADAARLLGIVYVPLLVVGACSGLLAAVPAVRRPPGARSDPGTEDRFLTRALGRSAILERFESGIRPRLLDWRAVVPTAATVAVFTALVLLVLAGGTIGTPLTTSSATVQQPGAAHPLSSSVPESYATAFEGQGVPASAEILVFGVVNDEPALVRGAEYNAFAAVSNATLVAGRSHEGAGEAVIGSDFADTHDVDVGDRVVLGGGVASTVDQIRVVGTYRAPGVQDDQLLVSVETARHLSLKRGTDVNFIRLSRPVEETTVGGGLTVLNVAVDKPATTDGVQVKLTVLNLGDTTATQTFELALGDQQVHASVTLEGGNQSVTTVGLTPIQPGTQVLTVGGQSRNLTVLAPDSLSVNGVPQTAPVGSAPLVTVETVLGKPVPNATVSADNRTLRTGNNGRVRLPLETIGSTTIAVEQGSRRWNRTVTVSADATRRLETTVTGIPQQVAAFTRPTAEIRAYNPWNQTVRETLEIRSNGERYRRQVSVEAGQTATRSVQLPRRPQGEYSVSVSTGGRPRTETTYQVVGDGRLSTVIAQNTETRRGAGLGVAIATTFGNLQVVVAGLVGLAGLMVTGALVASFSRTIHARRRSIGIYRATGATPRQIAALLLRDGAVIGSVSVTVGLLGGCAMLWALDARNALVFFGIRVSPEYSPATLGLVGASAFALVLVGVALAALAALRRQPATLLEPNSRASPGESMERASGTGTTTDDRPEGTER